MSHLPSPSQFDDAGKVAGAFLAIGAFVTGGIKWLKGHHQRKAEARQAELNAAVTVAVSAAMVEAETRAKAMFVEGAKQEQANMLTLLEGVRKVEAWMPVHEASDDARIGGLQHEVAQLREGQQTTHRTLGQVEQLQSEMRDMLIRTNEGVQWLKDERGGDRERRR